MSRADPKGAWHGRSPDQYVTFAAGERYVVEHHASGWFIVLPGNRARGPISSLSAAMEQADRIIADLGGRA